MVHVRLLAAAVIVAALALPAPAVQAAGGGSGSSTTSAGNTDFRAGRTAVEDGDFRRAIEHLTKVVAAEPRNADALNYLGYSHRRLGAFEPALTWYRKALAVEPDHRGANEYLGELYLQMGDLAKAEERLAVLDDACFFGCEEYDELKQAIADFKAGRKSGKADW